MEATIFTGWIYDHLLPHASTVAGLRLVGFATLFVQSAATLLIASP